MSDEVFDATSEIVTNNNCLTRDTALALSSPESIEGAELKATSMPECEAKSSLTVKTAKLAFDQSKECRTHAELKSSLTSSLGTVSSSSYAEGLPESSTPRILPISKLDSTLNNEGSRGMSSPFMPS